MTKETYRVKNIVEGLLSVPESEPMTIIAGSKAADRQKFTGAVADSSHLETQTEPVIYKRRELTQNGLSLLKSQSPTPGTNTSSNKSTSPNPFK